MHRSNSASKAKTQQQEQAIDLVTRNFPKRAEVIRIGKMVAGYRLTPARAKKRLGLLQLRVRELERLITHRFGTLRIETDDAELFAEIVAAHVDPNTALNWIERVCPLLGRAGPVIVAATARSQTWWSAKALGEYLRLTWEERRALRICTIRAADLPLAEARRRAKEIKREADRLRIAAKRRKEGIAPRRKGDTAAAEAAALGVDRRTVQRRRKRALEDACRPKVATTLKEHIVCDFRAASIDQPPASTCSVIFPIWSPRIVSASDSPETARLGALVAQHAAVRRLASQFRRAA